MAATITTVVDPDSADARVFLVTRRELAVLAVAVTLVVVATLLLVAAGGQAAAAFAAPS